MAAAMITAEPAPYCIKPKPKTSPTAKLRRGAKGRGDVEAEERFARFARGYQTDDVRQAPQCSLKKEARETNLRVTRRGRMIASNASQRTIRKNGEAGHEGTRSGNHVRIVPRKLGA